MIYHHPLDTHTYLSSDTSMEKENYTVVMVLEFLFLSIAMLPKYGWEHDLSMAMCNMRIQNK